MLKRKLFKRVLPMLLSAALVFQAMPATVSAAEGAASKAPASKAAASGETSSVTGGVSGEPVTVDAVGTTGGDDTLPQARLQVDRRVFTNGLYGYTYDYTADIIEAEYVKENPAYAQTVENAIANAITVYVGASADASLKGQLKYTWKKLTAGAYTALTEGTAPHEAGMYHLEVSLDAAQGKYSAAEPLVLSLLVKQAAISLDVVRNIEPGSTVGDVKKANADIGIHVHGEAADKADYVQEINWTVQYAHEDEASSELGEDTAKLLKNRDYLLVAHVTLKDPANYTVEKDSFNIVFGAAVPTEIAVTYTTEGQIIGKVYDGNDFVFNAEKPEYTAKVVYTGEDGKEQELSGAQIQGVWCDADKNEKIYAPRDAGVYYYKLFYTDESGSYAACKAYVRVEIRMIDIVVDPQPLADGDKVYEGMTAAEVLKNVTYKVYRVQDGAVSADAEPVGEYYWGTAYSQNTSKTQSYAPVFAMQKGQKGADGKIVWSDINSYETLEKSGDVSYRIVFTGQKALYNQYGDASNVTDINSAQENFCVDTTQAAIEKYAEDVTVLASTLVVIDAGAVPAPQGAEPNGTGDGADFAKPIVKVYDGTDLFKTKGEYKKAVVKAAAEGGEVPAGADSMLVYTWQKASSWDTDEQGQEYVSYWSDLTFNNVEVTSAPYAQGVYRLQISLDDPSKAFRAEPVDLYYVIKPQDVIVVLDGAPAIYADGVNTVGDLIDSLQNSDGEDVDTYVELEIYPVTLTEDPQTGKAVVTKGDTPLDNSFVRTFAERAFGIAPGWAQDEFFYVEKKETGGDAAGTWTRCNTRDVLEKNTEYRLGIESSYSFSGYNIGRKLDVHNRVLKYDYYENEGVAITCKDTQALEVAISVDESKLTGTVKTYDGNPFDSLDALKQLVKVTTVTDNADVTDKVKDKLFYVFYNNTLDIVSLPEEAIHAGNYSVYIFLETDDTYRQTFHALDTPYVIEKRQLTVTPRLREDIPAGLKVSGTTSTAGSIVEGYAVQGHAPCDESAEIILEMRNWKVHERTNDNANYYGLLKSSELYYVLGGTCSFNSRPDPILDQRISYSEDYEVMYTQAVFTPVKKAAAVAGVRNGELGNADTYTAVQDKVQNADGVYSHTITANESIPYLYPGQGLTIDGVQEGNFFLFKLYAPGDFWKTGYSSESWEDMDIVYENRIRQAKGHIVRTGWESGYSEGSNYQPYIIIAFDASKRESADFEIVWAKDYVERFTVDLTNCILEADFREAVAPKSMAFNGVSTKMAVGDTQQLDVKLTKAQMNDIILLGYSSSDEQVLKVSENGFVTALSASKSAVTVEVYPCRLVNGVKTPIEGAKHAKVSIKVSDVAAPKISKVTPKDTSAIINYTKPANGYRREIYVLEGKQTAQQFEDAIADVKNGDLSGFVYAQYVTSETTDKKGVTARTVGDLTPATSKASEYTVYVRNVAGLRKLGDGHEVAASHAGTVKTFKTIKSQATALRVSFDPNAKGQTAFYSYYDSYDQMSVYSASITGKSAKVSVDAKFYEKYSQSYSDEEDYIWRSLPLASDVKKNYTLPKMAYYVTEDVDNRLTVSGWSNLSEASKANYFYCADGYYYRKTAIASVDKSGKVTFKGKGEVYVIAADTNTGISGVVKLFIDANPDAVTAKAVKMTPGQSIRLSNVLEYQEKKIKIADYGRNYAELSTAQGSTEAFEIEDWDGDYYITALAAGAKLEFQVTDAAVAANGGSPVTVKLSTSAVEPVKNLKASEVYDDCFKVSFNYPLVEGMFRVELKDARNRVVSNELKALYADSSYDSKTKKYVYELEFNDKTITRLSNYTVTVAAVVGSASSKEAKLKVKTTNIPASYRKLDADEYGGCDIEVTTQSNGVWLSDGPVLKTGNTYTLSIEEENWEARYSQTDTLTWKSTNTKVASVKGNAGSFTAQFKTVKQGVTTIEVTSKVTKKVIARWQVRVNATGEANGYFGENEPYNGKATIGDGVDVNGRDILAVTADNQVGVTLNKGEEQWFVFTAPAYGRFSVSCSGGTGYVYDEEGNYVGSSSNQKLEKNTRRYIRIPNTASERRYVSVRVTFTLYQEVSLGETRVKAGKTILFRAPEDNYYTFTRVDGEEETQLTERSMNQDDTYELSVYGTAGKEYTIRVTKREAQTMDVGGAGVQVTLGAGEKKWFAVTAAEANLYKVYSTGATGNVTAKWYGSLQNSWSSDSKYGSPDFAFSEKTVQPGMFYLCLSSDDATEETPVTLTLHVAKREVKESLVPGEKEISLVYGEYAYYSFTADETGSYEVTVTNTSGYINAGYASELSASYFSGIYNYSSTTLSLEAGETIYLRLYTSSSSATAESPATGKLTITKNP